MSATAPAITVSRAAPNRRQFPIVGLRFQLLLFATGFLIVYSHRPDAVLNAQFYAEDGAIFYRDAYSLGLHSLFLVHGGYFHAVPRLAALFAQLFPLYWAPLILNVIAIAIQILPVNVFLSSRFSNIGLLTRLLASFVYLALPNSFEINATITNTQSHLILLACLLVLAPPARTILWKIFDITTLALTSLSTPMGIPLLPVAAFMWWKKNSHAVPFRALLPGSAIQAICVLSHWHTREAPHFILTGQAISNGGPLGPNFHYLNAILGGQVFYSSILGLHSQGWLAHLRSASIAEAALTATGVIILLFTLKRGPLELKLFILFAAAVLACALLNPLAGPSDHPQWYWLSNPGCGNRYYFLPMLAFLASLFWLARDKASAGFRIVVISLLLLLPAGICRDWQQPQFIDFHFKEFAQAFENKSPGTTFAIPINPGWFMVLTKH